MSTSIYFILEPSEEYEKGPDDTYYKYFEDEKHWYDAYKNCEDQHAHLVIDNSKDVHDYLADKFKKRFWIGATDLEKEGEWKWVERKRIQKLIWEVGKRVNKAFWKMANLELMAKMKIVL